MRIAAVAMNPYETGEDEPLLRLLAVIGVDEFSVFPPDHDDFPQPMTGGSPFPMPGKRPHRRGHLGQEHHDIGQRESMGGDFRINIAPRWIRRDKANPLSPLEEVGAFTDFTCRFRLSHRLIE